jgi:hypothetical protein
MEPMKNDLGRRLLVQQASDPEARARYQRGVDAMLERMRREAWWMGLAHSAVLVFFMVFLLFAGISLGYFTIRLAHTTNASVENYLLLLLGWTVLFGTALSLLWHLNRQLKVGDILVQMKELEMRLLELEERAMVVRVDQ